MRMKKKGMAKGGAMMKKKGYAAGGAMPMKKNPATGEMMPAYAMDGKGKMNKGGMMKKKGYAKGGMKKKGYAAGGKVMTYNIGGMVKSTGTINTGERYLPKKAIKSLSSSEYAATTKAKRKGTAAGKQNVAQPKKIAAKVKPYRKKT